MRFNVEEMYEDSDEDTQAALRTRASESRPGRNEDAVFCNGLSFGVFDGMGGHPEGERAAKLACRVIREGLKDIPPDAAPDFVVRKITLSFRRANEALFRAAEKDAKYHEMGTTATVARVCAGPENERVIIIGNAGDGRAYLYRFGKLEQLTVDDSVVPRVFRMKLDGARSAEELSPLARFFFKRRNLLKNYLGKKHLRVHIISHSLLPGDVLLFCTDGIHDNLTGREIAHVVADGGSSDEIAERLIAVAWNRAHEGTLRSKMDDMSVVVVKFCGVEDGR